VDDEHCEESAVYSVARASERHPDHQRIVGLMGNSTRVLPHVAQLERIPDVFTFVSEKNKMAALQFGGGKRFKFMHDIWCTLCGNSSSLVELRVREMTVEKRYVWFTLSVWISVRAECMCVQRARGGRGRSLCFEVQFICYIY